MSKQNTTRQIILDTETTGLSPAQGDRVIEIGCVELIDRKLTGKHFHSYIYPERQVNPAAFAVHGISDAFLKDKPLFAQISAEFVQYIQGAELVIHNAPFDVGFLDSEFSRLQLGNIADYCTVLDTLALAKKKHPGQQNSLNALCRRYSIDLSERKLHGALLDAELLAAVYLAMTGGQVSLFDEMEVADMEASIDGISEQLITGFRVIPASLEELAQHEAQLVSIQKASDRVLWLERIE